VEFTFALEFKISSQLKLSIVFGRSGFWWLFSPTAEPRIGEFGLPPAVSGLLC